MTLQNDRFLKALRLEALDTPPIWMMRQAGRYLPEYREVRAKAKNFMDFCRSPELCAEVALQPIDRFGFDASIVFSDILTVPDALGCSVEFLVGEGPQFSQPIRSLSDIKALNLNGIEKRLGYVMEAVASTKRALAGRVPLIGFCGSPWTLACYMIEGETSKTFDRPRSFVYQNPEALHALLGLLSEVLVDYLQGQIQHGADVIMIFDTWGGMLTESAYQRFSLDYMQKVIERLPAHVPTILFTKGGGAWLEKMAQTGCSALGLDWQTNLKQAFDRVGTQVALQGNLDPAALYGGPAVVADEVSQVLSQAQGKSGYIFNLGHGITPGVDPQAVKQMVDCVRAGLK